MADEVPATGNESSSCSVLYALMATIEDRRRNPPPRSYTTSLFAAGVETMGGKILEEAQEVVDAARSVETVAGRQHFVHEAADLLYHLMVLLGYHNVPLTDVEAELGRRFGISGLDEKAARKPS